MTLINGGRTNTLSANVHGAVNWWFCANIELSKKTNRETAGAGSGLLSILPPTLVVFNREQKTNVGAPVMIIIQRDKQQCVLDVDELTH